MYFYIYLEYCNRINVLSVFLLCQSSYVANVTSNIIISSTLYVLCILIYSSASYDDVLQPSLHNINIYKIQLTANNMPQQVTVPLYKAKENVTATKNDKHTEEASHKEGEVQYRGTRVVTMWKTLKRQYKGIQNQTQCTLLTE